MCILKKCLLVLLLLFFHRATPFSFDGRVTPSWVDYTPTLTNGDYVWGDVHFIHGFNIADKSTASVQLTTPVYERIVLGIESVMNVDMPFECYNGITMGPNSVINHNARRMIVESYSLDGQFTATVRGYINVNAPGGTHSQITTNGLRMGNSTLIVKPTSHIGIEWDFEDGIIDFGAYKGGDYETERGLFFKGPGSSQGVILLKNGNLTPLWQNTTGVPALRFYDLNRLYTNNIILNFIADSTYTFSGFGWYYPDTTQLGKVAWRVCDFYAPTAIGSFTIPKGFSVNFKNAVTIAAGPIYFDGCSLTFTNTVTLMYPAFIIDNIVSMDSTTNKKPLDIKAAHFLISPGAGINFVNGNINW